MMEEKFEVVEPEKKRKLTDVQRLVLAWKTIIDIPMEDKGWDRVFFKRYTKPAKDLLDLFGFDKAVELMDLVHEDMTNLDRTHTLETVVKLSDNYREKLK